ncbi:AAA family ATPase [Flavicella sediminum]|uniref:AAA family ATPase n=1 Tax=Flavicella sediminum TaxID=2585141 RepID=UPI00111E2B52|nr:AAA family ATPase [Flavicella sediminum]
METINLKKLTVRNFKGIRDLTIDFKKETFIYGKNGVGKTTVFDAFTFLFFGKDSTGRSQFQVKTLDTQNNVIPKLEHEVAAEIETSNQTIVIKRILKEKWVKKRGFPEPQFNGNETLYYWNDVPMLAKEFQGKVNGLLDEGVFKLITNPLYFNSLKWQDRREVLIRICGNLTDDEVAQGNEDYIKLITGLQNKTIEEYRREIASKKKKLNADLKAIPTRIDEVDRNLPEAIDFNKVRNEIAVLEGELAAIEESLSDKSKALTIAQNKQTAAQADVHAVKNKIQKFEFDEQQKLNSLNNNNRSAYNTVKIELDNKKSTVVRLEGLIDSKKGRLELLTGRRNRLAKEWDSENSKTFIFNENDCACPTCKRAFEADDIAKKRSELETNFNKNKSDRLQAINVDGKGVTAEIKELETQISVAEKSLKTDREDAELLQQKLKKETEKLNSSEGVVSLETVLAMSSEYKTLKSELVELEGKVVEVPRVDNTELLSEKNRLTSEIAVLNKSLNAESTILKGQKRMTELKEEEKNLSQQISELESTEFTVESFIKTKIESLENKINQKFQLVKFKLFDVQINGGETECCEALIDGVPFTDLNNAARINAGIDIINTLCGFYKVSAPIFIDNRESVVDIIDCNSQIINLIVSKPDLNLRIA